MGSFFDVIKCPMCGQEAYVEQHYKVGEENIQCHHCGYGRRMWIANLDKQVDEGDKWMPDYKVDVVHGFGCYKVLGKKSTTFECGAFTSPGSVKQFIEYVESIKDEIDHAEYSVFKGNEEIENHVLIKGPEGRTWQN